MHGHMADLKQILEYGPMSKGFLVTFHMIADYTNVCAYRACACSENTPHSKLAK